MKTNSKRWTRDELLIVLNLYHKLPFGQFSHHNAAIKMLAEKLRRTPSSVSMKLCNMASFDPVLKMRGIKGLAGASRLDRETWEEFSANLEDNLLLSEEKMHNLFEVSANEDIEVSAKHGIQRQPRSLTSPEYTETQATVKQRCGQSYFRDLVLNNYDEQCAISRIAVRELLIASHILPWSSHPRERLNVRNGISLSRLHDAAFDCGLIAFDDDLHMNISTKLRVLLASQKMLAINFEAFEGVPLFVPQDAFTPDPAFLAEHRKTIFRP